MMKYNILFISIMMIMLIGFSSAITWDNTAYYALDETSGAVTDETGVYNGVVINGTVQGVSGKLGKAYNFTTSLSQWVNTSISPDYADFTLSLWLKMQTGTSIIQTPISYNGATYGIKGIRLADGNITANLGNGTNRPTIAFSATNTWVHIVIVRDSINNEGRLYINGTLADNGSIGTNSGTLTETPTLAIGAAGLGADFYNGTIDEVGIWNRALTPTEISELYNNSNAAQNNISQDTTPPIISISSPIALINYLNHGNNLTLNFTAIDPHLTNCWYSYNGSNSTQTPCINDTLNSFQFISTNQKNITVYANDTKGNLGSKFISWNYSIFENSRTYNSTAFETSYENYYINVTSNSSFTNIELLFNQTAYGMTNNGNGIWSYARDLPSSSVGNNSIQFRFTFNGGYIYSDNSSQKVNQTILGLCNASLTIPYLNITFQDEVTLATLTASVNLMTWNYWLGTGSQSKTLSFINNSVNPSYAFCLSPSDRILNYNYSIQYQNGTAYPARNSKASGTLNSTVTNRILSLLGSTTGIYSAYQVVNLASQPLQGALVEIFYNTELIESGLTDGSGLVTFFLNPLRLYTINASKVGYPSVTTFNTPTQGTYTITLGEQTLNITVFDYSQGINFTTQPLTNYLINDTTYQFNYSLTSTFWNVDTFGFTLSNSSGSIIGSATSNSNGGFVSTSINVGNDSSILMSYYYVINGTSQNFTRFFNIQDSSGTDWSIARFFSDLNLYIDSGIFGLDSFGKNIIVFITIFLITGGVSYKFGFTSPAYVLGVMAVCVLLFDSILGLVTYPANLTRIVDHPASWIISIVWIGFLVKEAYT